MEKGVYKQCVLRKGSVEQVSWIPSKFAKVGKFLKLKDNNGWEVISAGSVDMEHNEVLDRSQDYKKNRRASDI